MRSPAALTAALLGLTVAVGPTPLGATPAAAAERHAVPASVARDCSRPVTEELNSWLADLPDGTAGSPLTVDFGAGCFLLDDIEAPGTLDVDGVQVIDKSHWRITGSATLRFDTTVPTRPVGGKQRAINRSELTIRNGKDITLSGLTLQGKRSKDGYDPNLEHDHNLTILGSRDIRVEKISTREAAGDNIAIKAHGDQVPTNISVRESTLQGASRHNISLTGGDGIVLAGNRLDGNGYWSIDAELHAGHWPLRRLSILNNTASGSRYGFLALSSRSDATAGGVSDVRVIGNALLDPPLTVWEFVNINASAGRKAPTSRVLISHNDFTVKQHGVSAKWVDDLLVTGNNGRTTAHGSGADCSRRRALLAVGDGMRNARAIFNRWESDNLWTPTTGFCVKQGTTVRPV